MIVVLFVGGLASTVAVAAILVPAWTFAHIIPDVTRGGPLGLLVYGTAM